VLTVLNTTKKTGQATFQQIGLRQAQIYGQPQTNKNKQQT
jgi:hypothetical protein